MMIPTTNPDYIAKGSLYAVAVDLFSGISVDFVLCGRVFTVALLLQTLRRLLYEKWCSYLSLDSPGGLAGDDAKAVKSHRVGTEAPRNEREETPKDLAQLVALTISPHGQPSKTLAFYKEFSAKKKHVHLNEALHGSQHTALNLYAALVHCADRVGRQEYVLQLLKDMDEAGIGNGLQVYESAIQVLARRKFFKEAIQVSERIDRKHLKPTPVTLSRLVGCAAELGNADRANDFFKKLCTAPLQDALVKASLTMLRLFAKKEDWNSSLEVFKQMRTTSMKVEPIQLNVALATGVASGELKAATNLFREEYSVADVISHNTILKGLAQQGDIDAVLKFLDQMKASGVPPNVISFNTSIDSAIRANRTSEAWRLFEIMQKQHGISPDKCTCSTLVKGFSKTTTSDQITAMLDLIDDVFEDCSSQLRNSLLCNTLDASLRLHRFDHAMRIFGKMSSHQMGSYGVAACWTSLSRLPHAGGSRVQRDAHLLEPLLLHTISAAKAGNLNARALAAAAQGAASSKLGRSSGRLFAVLAEAMKPKLTNFDVQDLANTAWAFAKAGPSDSSLFVALAEVAKPKLSEFKTQHLANMAWAFAKAGQFDASFFAAVAEAAKLKLSKFNAQDVANTAWAFAKASRYDSSLFVALAAAAKLKLSEFSAQGLANTAWAFATAGQSDASFFVALAKAAKRKLVEFNVQNLANMAWAFAKVGQVDECLFAALAETAKPKLRDFNQQELANTAWAFATAGQCDTSLFTALAEAVTPRLTDFSAQALANTAWAFAKVGHYDALLFDAMAKAAKLRMGNFNAQDIANTALAFAKVGHSDDSLFVALAEAAKLKIIWFSAQDLANTAWAFTRAAPDKCIASRRKLESLASLRIHHGQSGQSGQCIAEGQLLLIGGLN